MTVVQTCALPITNDLSKVKQIYLSHLSNGNIKLENAVNEIKKHTGKPTKAFI